LLLSIAELKILSNVMASCWLLDVSSQPLKIGMLGLSFTFVGRSVTCQERLMLMPDLRI